MGGKRGGGRGKKIPSIKEGCKSREESQREEWKTIIREKVVLRKINKKINYQKIHKKCRYFSKFCKDITGLNSLVNSNLHAISGPMSKNIIDAILPTH